ncbi:MAG: D-glycero-beta-D-manno-heptose-7-phosphate kinase [Elusimicrobiota bacterium]
MDRKSKQTLLKIIKEFKNKKIAIIGDIILDRYIFGKVKRISPEAPVPVLEVVSQKTSFGGASNVANNISDLGAKSYLVSVIGNDLASDEILSMIGKKGNIYTDYIIKSDFQKTPEKTRAIAEHQQIVRIDKEVKFSYTHEIKKKILYNIDEVIKKKVDAIILSDYGKGVLSKEIIEYSISKANLFNIPIFVDPKIEHFFSYKKITSMTPNITEAFSGMRKIESKEQKDIEKLGVEIVKKLRLKSLIITQSENGMTVFDNFNGKIKISHIPTEAREVYDVTGAGDTVISVLSLAYACSKDILTSAVISNYAAGIVVAKLGTATATVEELIEAINK